MTTVALTLAALPLAACSDSSAPQASASPLPTTAPATVGVILQPPSGPITAVDNSPAGMALAAAGRRTAAAGSLRMRLVAHVGTPGGARTLDLTGAGEAESAARSHLQVTVNLSGRTVTTQSLTYDGALYSRGEGEQWKRVTSPGSNPGDPRNYLNFVSGAQGVVDAGPGTRVGVAAEQYQATATSTGGSQPVGGVGTTPTSTTVKVTAWVDRAAGRLVALDLLFPDIGAGAGSMSIDFSDFGAAIKVVPPTATP